MTGRRGFLFLGVLTVRGEILPTSILTHLDRVPGWVLGTGVVELSVSKQVRRERSSQVRKPPQRGEPPFSPRKSTGRVEYVQVAPRPPTVKLQVREQLQSETAVEEPPD